MDIDILLSLQEFREGVGWTLEKRFVRFTTDGLSQSEFWGVAFR